MMEGVAGVLIGAALIALVAVAARGLWVMWRGTMIEERPVLMHRMLKRQGVTIAGVEDYATLEQACHAARRCVACRDLEACKAWLDGGKTESYEAFCPNVEFIEQLKHQQAA
jgi:Family of unknown function (DUF6455)